MFRSIEDGGDVYTRSKLIEVFGTDNISIIKKKIDNLDDIFYSFIHIE